eukprot:gene7254-7829_t
MDPIVIFFAGKVGVGKSRTINNLVGSVVSRSSAAAESVTTRTSVVYQGTLGNTSVKLLDSSGLQDPHKKNVDTISDITNFIVSEGGIDVLYHIVSLGRLTDADIAIPNLLLDGLSSNSTERALGYQVAQRMIGELNTHITQAEERIRKANEEAAEAARRAAASVPQIVYTGGGGGGGGGGGRCIIS